MSDPKHPFNARARAGTAQAKAKKRVVVIDIHTRERIEAPPRSEEEKPEDSKEQA